MKIRLNEAIIMRPGTREQRYHLTLKENSMQECIRKEKGNKSTHNQTQAPHRLKELLQDPATGWGF